MSDKAPTFALLDETNYHEWAFFMEAVLIWKGLLGTVEGTITQPLGSPNSKAVKAFVDKQKLTRAEIILRVSPSQLPQYVTVTPSLLPILEIIKHLSLAPKRVNVQSVQHCETKWATQKLWEVLAS